MYELTTAMEHIIKKLTFVLYIHHLRALGVLAKTLAFALADLSLVGFTRQLLHKLVFVTQAMHFVIEPLSVICEWQLYLFRRKFLNHLSQVTFILL